MAPMAPQRHLTWRIQNIPSDLLSKPDLTSHFHTDDRKYIDIKSMAPDVTNHDNDMWTATMVFSPPEPRSPRQTGGDLDVDKGFMGFTPLNTPADDVSADIIAVTGLAGHAFGSWAHSDQKMWLRDYLPNDIQNRARILIYGYESQLRGTTAATSSIADFADRFTQDLMDLRDHASCRDRPLILIGHSLGGIIIKHSIANLEPDVRSRLPVRTVIFFGAPHLGLEVAALETLVEGCPTQTLISELKRDSPTLSALSRRFRRCAEDLGIHSYFENRLTSTVIQGPDGKWARGGPPKWMVPKSSAVLNTKEEATQLQVDADHKEMARLRRGQGGVYPNVLRIIKDALKSASEQFAAAPRPVEEWQPSTPSYYEPEAESKSQTLDDDGQWDNDNLLCDACSDLFPKTQTHHHCYICDNGNFNVCRSCKKSGKSCPGGHMLRERRLGDSATADNVECDDNDIPLICDYCDEAFPGDQVHFHCIICSDGDYDLCLACRKRGRICPGRHKMVKRQLPSKTTFATKFYGDYSDTAKYPSPATSPPPPEEAVTEYYEDPYYNYSQPRKTRSPKPYGEDASLSNPLACQVCESSFSSRNQLFNHLREEDHMV